MMPLGTPAPSFSLPDTVSGKTITFEDIARGPATVVMFLCNHCPFVVHVNDELVRLSTEYMQKGVGFVAISSNDAQTYPDDAPDKMKALAERIGYPFAYLYDESQAVARAYDAACTPDIFVFDRDHKCAYRGRLDGSSPGNEVPTDGSALRAALDDILAGKPVSVDQVPSIGCGIKWKNL